MDLVYPVYPCFQRGFDDLRHVRLQMEALACEEIFRRAEKKQVRLTWSFMHDDESELCPFADRKYEALRLGALCDVEVSPTTAIQSAANSFVKQGHLSAKDAVHLACALSVRADCLVTCDGQFLRQAQRLKLRIAILNPVDYIQREGIS